MPSIKDFEKKQGNHQNNTPSEENDQGNHKSGGEKVVKRRPGREGSSTQHGSAPSEKMNEKTKINVVHVEASEESIVDDQKQSPAESSDKVEITFPGSELIRAKFPLSFEFAENVITDWVKDGNFENLPLKQPLAKTVAQQGLLKAKQLEKKVMAHPMTEKVAMQAFTYAIKAQGFFNEIKTKVNEKRNERHQRHEKRQDS